MKTASPEIGKTRQNAATREQPVTHGIAASRGVLALPQGEARPDVTRWAPPAGLAACVAYAWRVEWNLKTAAAHRQETAPHPNTYLVLDSSKLTVAGVSRRRFTRTLEGAGWAFGVKFRPGGLRAFVDWPMADITDRTLPAEEIFGEGATTLRHALLHAASPAMLPNLTFEFLGHRIGVVDPAIERAAALVDRILTTSAIKTVDDLAQCSRLSVRALQRIFREFVGVSPKWVIQRYRLHELIARLQGGGKVNWAALAQELGYFDQAHLIKDFKAVVGRAPEEYRREAASPKI